MNYRGFKFMICKGFEILILGVYIMPRMQSAHTYMHTAAARIHTCLEFRVQFLGFGVQLIGWRAACVLDCGFRLNF